MSFVDDKNFNCASVELFINEVNFHVHLDFFPNIEDFNLWMNFGMWNLNRTFVIME